MLKDLNFANGLKLADIVPVFKKDDSTLVKNYRPVSLLPIISKIFERINQVTANMNEYCIYQLISVAIEKVLVRKLLFLLLLRSGNKFWIVRVMELLFSWISKAFDTINHELLIDKLHAYSFSKKSLTIIFNYLPDRCNMLKLILLSILDQN